MLILSINSSPPSSVYMCRWTRSVLVQVMAWHRTGDKPLPELICWCIGNWTIRNKVQWKFNRNSNNFIQEKRLKMSFAKRRTFCLGRRWVKLPGLPVFPQSCLLNVMWRCLFNGTYKPYPCIRVEDLCGHALTTTPRPRWGYHARKPFHLFDALSKFS